MIRPILFNGEMVRAILEGRKTVTRRKIDIDISNQFDVEVNGSVICYIDRETGDRYKPEEMCRYHPGDILYVRETWGFNPCTRCANACNTLVPDTYKGAPGCFVYRTDYGTTEDDTFPPSMHKWHPSIHMPKEAARIWLKVTDVRVERLQKITSDQIEKEGIKTEHPHVLNGQEQQYAFSQLWDSTISKKDMSRYGWKANPWVWVIEFERCRKPEPCILRGVEPAEEKRPCIGYGDAWADEPCEMCKGCSQCTGNDEEAEE